MTTRVRRLPTDVRVLDVGAEFRDVPFEHPLELSGGAIRGYSLAIASVTVAREDGLVAQGRGAGVLSVPWAWPVSALSVPRRDAVLRALTLACADLFTGMGSSDPLTLYDDAIRHLPARVRQVADAEGITESIPPLAAMLALASIDNGVHDAWARAAGRSAYNLYTREHVRTDVDLVAPHFRRRLPIQHVVGLADRLTAADGSGSERSLEDWIQRDGIAHVKVKISGKDPDVDADRIAAVDAVMRERSASEGSISLDANEGFTDVPALIDMLDRLEARHPDTLRRIAYVEQPVPRDHVPDGSAMRVAGRRVPLLVDEGLGTPDDLPRLAAEGWTGIVVKAARGQSLAVRSHAFARQFGLWATIQDLTAVDLALEHSARLAGSLRWSSPAFEFNSRQYAPASNASLARRRPGLVRVADGSVSIALPSRPGLY